MSMLLTYYNQRIIEPEEVRIKTNEYRVNNDILQQFLSEQCTIEKGNRSLAVFSIKLWDLFECWRNDQGYEIKIKRGDFYNKLDKITCYKRVDKVNINGERSTGWYGIKCNMNDE